MKNQEGVQAPFASITWIRFNGSFAFPRKTLSLRRHSGWLAPLLITARMRFHLRRVNIASISIPMLMISVEDRPECQQQALEAGINEYLVKPVTKQMIEEKLAWLGLTSG